MSNEDRLTEDDEPQAGSDGWYVVWNVTNEEGDGRNDYAERFDSREAAMAAIVANRS